MTIDDHLAGLAGPLRDIVLRGVDEIDPALFPGWLRAAAVLEEA
ncbi:hypothetical protein [Micromonospora orduensis]